MKQTINRVHRNGGKKAGHPQARKTTKPPAGTNTVPAAELLNPVRWFLLRALARAGAAGLALSKLDQLARAEFGNECNPHPDLFVLTEAGLVANVGADVWRIIPATSSGDEFLAKLEFIRQHDPKSYKMIADYVADSCAKVRPSTGRKDGAR